MNDPTLIGPCADYEYDLLDLHDGILPAERAHAVRLHVGQCARCSTWAQAFAALDERLAAGLPQPQLSVGFDARLYERVAALSRPVVRDDLRSSVEREHDSIVDGLRRGARRNALLGAIGWAGATACTLLVARELLSASSGVLVTVSGGIAPPMVLGVVGIAVAIAGLAWTRVRGGLPLPG